MTRARVIVDSHLRLECDDEISSELIETLMEELSLPNLERAKARNVKRWGWQDMPTHIPLYDTEDQYLIMPRGFALDFKQGLREYGLRVKWIDRTTWEQGEPYGGEEFEFRHHQLPAIDAFRKHRQGMYRSPTGAGKSGTAGGFLWDMRPRRALILVDKINLLDQWVKDLRKLLGEEIDVHTIGSGHWSEGRITIASLQTIWRRRQQLLEMGWFRKHSVVFLDECHHATAMTYRELMQLFWARYRIGFSATPDKTGDFKLALLILGPIFHEDTDEEMRDAGYIVAPTVNVIHTDFDFHFWGDHKVDEDEECEVPGCKRNGTAHGHRNNYGKMKQALIDDHERNKLIGGMIAEWHGQRQLVISTETKLLDNLFWAAQNAGVDPTETFMLTGKNTRKQRREILEKFLASARGVLFSTVAGEALNVPEIDCVHLPFPTKNPRSTEQNIGRGVRWSEDKQQPVVFDYADTRVWVFVKQFKSRRWKCYEPLGLVVNTDYKGERR